MSNETRRGMNCETRDELLRKVKTYLADFQDTTGYDNHDMNALGDTYAQSIITLVTAARDAEIRELLLSDSTTLRVEATVSYMDGHRDRDIAVGAIGAALGHIGLHGDGTGGQG